MDILLVWQEVCAFIPGMVSHIYARYVVAGFRNKMRIKMKINPIKKERILEKIKDLGIGAYIIGVGIFFIILMIGWLIYKMFIFYRS